MLRRVLLASRDRRATRQPCHLAATRRTTARRSVPSGTPRARPTPPAKQGRGSSLHPGRDKLTDEAEDEERATDPRIASTRAEDLHERRVRQRASEGCAREMARAPYIAIAQAHESLRHPDCAEDVAEQTGALDDLRRHPSLLRARDAG